MIGQSGGSGDEVVTKTERWLNLLAFLLDRHYPVPREEILSQVDDYKADWLKGDDKTRESVRRKFERDKKELKALGVLIEPLKDRVIADPRGPGGRGVSPEAAGLLSAVPGSPHSQRRPRS